MQRTTTPPPELRCSGRRSCYTAVIDAAGAAMQRSSMPPELHCSGRDTAGAAMQRPVDAAGVVLQRPQHRRSCYAAVVDAAEAAMQQTSMPPELSSSTRPPPRKNAT